MNDSYKRSYNCADAEPTTAQINAQIIGMAKDKDAALIMLFGDEASVKRLNQTMANFDKMFGKPKQVKK